MAPTKRQQQRTDLIVSGLDDAFAPLELAPSYAARVREDHALFVDAFREARIGISAT
jgi:hypothetical protein